MKLSSLVTLGMFALATTPINANESLHDSLAFAHSNRLIKAPKTLLSNKSLTTTVKSPKRLKWDAQTEMLLQQIRITRIIMAQCPECPCLVLLWRVS